MNAIDALINDESVFLFHVLNTETMSKVKEISLSVKYPLCFVLLVN